MIGNEDDRGKTGDTQQRGEVRTRSERIAKALHVGVPPFYRLYQGVDALLFRPRSTSLSRLTVWLVYSVAKPIPEGREQ